MNTGLLDHLCARHRALAAGDDPLVERRRAAWARFAQSGWPQRKAEAWRYTPLPRILDAARWSRPAQPAGTPPRPDVLGTLPVHLSLDGGRLARPAAAPAGVAVATWDELDATARARWAARLDRTIDPALGPFALLNLALCETPVLIEVAGEAAGPLVIACTGRDGVHHPRIALALAPGAHLELIEVHTAGSGALENAVVEIELGAGARLDHLRIDLCDEDAIGLAVHTVNLAEGSRYHGTAAQFGCRGLVRSDTRVLLEGAGTEAALQGFYLAQGDAQAETRLDVQHRVAGGTTSRCLFKGLADDAGRAVFNGRIHIHPGAAGSDAQLQNKNLLLSTRAEIDTKPELEIYNDDVQCAHGATVGALDPLQLFALRSRGIDAQAARALLCQAFLAEPLAALGERPAAAALRALLAARLGGAPA